MRPSAWTPAWTPIPLIATIAAVLVCACGRGDPPVDRERAKQVQRCAQALEASVPEKGRAKLQTLITGCAEVCPELLRDAQIPAEDRAGAEVIVAACHGFCTESAERAWAASEPGGEYAALVRECGPESYGLTADSGPLLSATWLLLLRVHEWLEQHRRHASRETRGVLESAGMHAHFSLPLPPRLDGVYTLAHAQASVPMSQAFYVIVEPAERGRAIRAAAVPVARLRPRGLEQRPLPGGYFPGKVLAPPGNGYLQRYRILEGMHPTAAHSTIDPVPAVFIDHSAPVGELLRVMNALEQSEIALAVTGHTAHLHPVRIRQLAASGQAPLTLVQESEGLVLIGAQRVPVSGGGDRPGGFLDALRAAWPEQSAPDAIAVQMAPGADVAALVAVMDLIAEAQIRVVQVRLTSTG